MSDMGLQSSVPFTKDMCFGYLTRWVHGDPRFSPPNSPLESLESVLSGSGSSGLPLALVGHKLRRAVDWSSW